MQQEDNAIPGPAETPPGPEGVHDHEEAEAREASPRRGLSRRGLFAGAAGSVVAGALLGAGGTAAAYSAGRADTASDEADAVDLSAAVPFYDQGHQAGIVTPPQRYATFMTFDLADSATTTDLQVLLARWTAAIGQMVQGLPIGVVEPSRPDAVGVDTGEAVGLNPASLTVTVGLGPGVFDDRFGLASKRPALLADLERIPGDRLDPALSGGDLSVQACADDPQVAYHAVRNLARMVTTTAQTRWVVMGFGRASAGAGQQTPRNLFGFKDGTRNVTGEAEHDRFVWLDDAGWMAGGTYQVVRKIRMTIESWDADRVSDQQSVFGRTKDEGAPLGGAAEFDTPDFVRTDDSGTPVIDPLSHIALAAPENNAGVKILRRSYNYTDGLNAQGLLDAGLLFVSYQNDPAHFVTLQHKLGRFDLLNEYIQHIGSAVFAVPPGPARGGYIGQALFA
ncbi:iron uptake transporter deferrochelatase/peroxidase subunit [Propionicicella superfundia]|uniref:iron uptake transporter deferrochelatase/peroxidase subunit n=1 Tax=Propionicicella superfundia TaxID=348582 RepID=UPI00041D829A|nr:iron uptake transporter deferrochelatase/peroxidase subunit [Propionicicella superfundia]